MPEVEMTEDFERHRVADPEMCMAGSFRTQDIGRPGYSKRVACINVKTGKWMTQSFLVAHVEHPEMKKKLRRQASALRSRLRRR